MRAADAAAAASSVSAPTPSSSVATGALLSLRDFGVSAGNTLDDLQHQYGSFQLLAWFGDHLLERFVTERIWERAMTNESKDGAASAASSNSASAPPAVSIQSLHDERVRFTNNITLSLYLKHATNIRLRPDPSGTSPSHHATGTLFEFLLCLASRSAGGLALARQRVNEYMDWVGSHADLVDAKLPRTVQSVTLQLSWLAHNPALWKLTSEDLHSKRIVARSLIVRDQEEDPTQPTEQVLAHIIAREQKTRERRRAAELELAQEQRRLAAEKLAAQQSMLQQVTDNPCCSVLVPPTQRAVLSADLLNVELVDVALLNHTGKVVEVRWKSRQKNVYLEPFWDCCGMRGATRVCNRPNWPDPSAVHPGNLEDIPFGTNKYRMGGGVHKNESHLPVGQYPNWSCCNRTSIAVGCARPSAQPVGAHVAVHGAAPSSASSAHSSA